MTATAKISRDDFESKFRELRGEVDTAKDQARNYALIGGAVALLLVVLLSFMLGRRKGKKKSTVVEIRRL